ncbi:MAG TPA: glycosyltransferase family A protein, partial [Bryobacteraceae bacterium]|nr:glycosyltransferase family A protein [Bryobacteraceae bacterium]
MHEVSPAVSVVLPAYNVTRYIGEALDSIFRQTFQHFEIIVVNDGCPDSEALERVLEPYRPRIRYVCQANAGIAGARNAGIREATAPLIVNLDPDDLMEPTCLEDQVLFMQAHPQIAARYVNPVYFGGTNLDGAHWMDINPSERHVSFRSVMAGRTCPANPGSILRRDTIMQVGWYDDSFVDSWEDFDLWLRILRGGEQISY